MASTQTDRRAARKLWVPQNAQPSDRCRVCDKPFYAGEERALVRHVRGCADQYARAESPRVKMPSLMDPAHAPDPEYERWVKQQAAAILAGRVRM